MQRDGSGIIMKVFGYSFAFFILCFIHPGNSYRILGLLPYNAASHFRMFERLMKGLAERGHQIDIVSHFPQKKPFPNYHDIIDLSGSMSTRQNNVTYEYLKPYLNAKSMAYAIATEGGGDLCHSMGNPRFKELVKNPPKDPPYDLVITELFGAHCYMAMGQHLGVPVVAIVTSAMWPWANYAVANPEEPAYVPHLFSQHDGPMNFWQRVVNTVELAMENWIFKYYTLDQNDFIHKYIGPHAPSVRDAEKNVSLVLVNSHFSLNGARPFTTAVVEVGGLHIPDVPEPLPIDLQQWLDDSKDGVVYISFGSMMKIESFPEKMLHQIYASLEKLAPVRVLMKIADATKLPPGLPNNVLTRPWVPQLSVLKHEHTRAFLTHGGLLGTQEAIHCGVPMIGVPLFADQGQNVEIYVKKHVAVSLSLDDLTEEKLDAAFTKILGDSSYKEAAKKLSVEFSDRPMPPLDTAIFWVEYVIRHGGRGLRSPAMDLTWWQIRILDVYGILLSVAIILLYLFVLATKKLVAITRRKIMKYLTYSKKQK